MKTAIKPENITGRSPARIVAEAEAGWLKPYLIVKDLPTEAMPEIVANTLEHLEACRCNACFNKKLDALIASQEEALKNQGV